jgi:hypothetical protein
MVTAAINRLITAVGRGISQCPSMGEWIKMWWTDTEQPSKKISLVGRVAQVVECLLNKHEALPSNPNAAKKKKKDKFCHLWHMDGTEDIMLSKINQVQKDKCHMFSLMGRS